MDMKELFKNNCFPMGWSDEKAPEVYVPQRKELSVLLAELEEIKNHIENIKAKQWHLEKLAMFHRGGLAAD